MMSIKSYINRRAMSAMIFMTMITMANAAVPSRITYQGRLSKSGVGAAGRHTIFVQFIDKEGNNLPAAQPFDVDVPASGDFSLDITNIPPDADWINGLPKMRVIVGGETLTPDQSFSATPYALVARNVENLDTSKVKLSGDDGGALLSSWQSPTNKSKINADVIVGTITTTANHGKEHALDGKDQIPVGTLNPSQIKDTALVLTSSFTQVIEPTQPVVPLVVKGQKNTGPTLNMFEVWDNAAVQSKQFQIQGNGNALFKGNVGIGTLSPLDKLHIIAPGGIRLEGDQSAIKHYDSGGTNRFLTGLRSDVAGTSNFTFYSYGGNWYFHSGNVGIGTNAPTNKLEVIGDAKISGSIGASTVTVTGRYRDRSGEVMPVGVVLPFAGATIPQGWLLCDGSIYSIASRPELNDLRQIVNSIYGGDGATTFGVPDLRRRVPVGAGETGTPTLASTLGSKGGEENHTLTIPEMPAHHHTYLKYTHTMPQSGAATWCAVDPVTADTSDTGGGLPHNNMQPSIVLNYIIKY